MYVGFSCVLSYCVNAGGGYKLIFGTGTRLTVETSKFIIIIGALACVNVLLD